MNQPATIFVSIASYRDPELLPTLRDMLRHAAYPENLHIAICWQDDKTSDFFESAGFVQQQRRIFNGQEIVTFLFNKARIDIIMVHYFISQGASWARSLAEALFENEQYFLQIDSHCRFIPDWDNEMITMLRMLQAQSPHPVISSYPPAYTPGNNEAGCKKSDVSRLIFREYDRQGIPCSARLLSRLQHRYGEVIWLADSSLLRGTLSNRSLTIRRSSLPVKR